MPMIFKTSEADPPFKLRDQLTIIGTYFNIPSLSGRKTFKMMLPSALRATLFVKLL